MWKILPNPSRRYIQRIVTANRVVYSSRRSVVSLQLTMRGRAHYIAAYCSREPNVPLSHDLRKRFRDPMSRDFPLPKL